jgi:hypothetical protein
MIFFFTTFHPRCLIKLGVNIASHRQEWFETPPGWAEVCLSTTEKRRPSPMSQDDPSHSRTSLSMELYIIRESLLLDRRFTGFHAVFATLTRMMICLISYSLGASQKIWVIQLRQYFRMNRIRESVFFRFQNKSLVVVCRLK